MSHSSDSILIEHPNRLTASMHTIIRVFRKLSFYPVSISELLLQLEEVTTPVHLTRTVNRAQNLLWKLPTKEQGAFRQNLVNVLSKHVLHGAQEEMRLEAAGWLRLFVQAGQVAQPADIFVTLVTAAIHAPLSHHTSLASTHNPPPAEANQGERKIRGTPPFPRQGASRPAPPFVEWMPVLLLDDCLKKSRFCGKNPVIPHKFARDPSPSFLRASAHALRMPRPRAVILSAAQ